MAEMPPTPAPPAAPEPPPRPVLNDESLWTREVAHLPVDASRRRVPR
jgi:hypothetical protein